MVSEQTPEDQQQSAQKMADLSSSSNTNNLLEKAVFILRDTEVERFQLDSSSVSVCCASRRSNFNDQSPRLNDQEEFSHNGIVGYVDESYIWSKDDHNSPSDYSSGSNSVDINDEEVESLRKTSKQRLFKRPRIETPNQMVATEPCGLDCKAELTMFDEMPQLTSLCRMVSPFGYVDAASVLSEAFEYIRFLHGQIEVLNRGNANGGGLLNVGEEKKEDVKKQELEKRGLCLVSINHVPL